MGAAIAKASKACSSAVAEEAPDDLPEAGRKHRAERLEECYRLGRTVGSGAYSKVKLIIALPKPGQLNEYNETRASIMREIEVALDLDHPNIVGVREYFVQGNKVYVIMELLRGGELLDAVVDKGHYSEDDARVVFVQLIRGVRYLHSMGVVHRDLKLDNLLLARPGDITSIKIADFGIAKQFGNGMDPLKTVCGTPSYMAPEVILARWQGGAGAPHAYTPACDLWSAGVILYMLLSGGAPFRDESQPALLHKIVGGKYDFRGPAWASVSDEAKDLIARFLAVDPAQRLDCAGAAAHPWMRAGAPASPHSPRSAERLAHMQARMLEALEGSRHGQPPLHERIARAVSEAEAARGAPRGGDGGGLWGCLRGLQMQGAAAACAACPAGHRARAQA
eukprot:scaffold2.g7252.t1